jgi:hypothetical protein
LLIRRGNIGRGQCPGSMVMKRYSSKTLISKRNSHLSQGQKPAQATLHLFCGPDG